MIYTIEQIKYDLEVLSEKQFYTKYMIRSDNWYFENYLGKNPKDAVRLSDDYRLIVSESLGVSYNSVMMVGSGKIGYSLSPPNLEHPEISKTFLPFNDDEKIRKISDIDIAIISSDIFSHYWKKFRNSFKPQYKNLYAHLYQEIYRGYINERNIQDVDGCRKEWNETAVQSKKKLHGELYFRHEVSYRIYRSWEDFEEYNIQNIKKLQREVRR